MKYNNKNIIILTILLLVVISIAWNFYLKNNSTVKIPKKATLVKEITFINSTS